MTRPRDASIPGAPPTVGAIAEFDEGGTWRLGVITAIGNRNLTIQVLRGRARDIPRTRIAWILPAQPGTPPDAQIDALDRARLQPEHLQQIWEALDTAGDDEPEVPFDHLCRAGGLHTDVQRFALHRALRDDATWFRRSRGRWFRRKPEDVRRDRDRRARLEQRAASRTAFLRVASDALANGTHLPSPLPDDWRDLVRLLEQHAAAGDDAREIDEIRPLLDELAEASGVSLGDARWRALNVLVRTGLQHPDVNPWILGGLVDVRFPAETLAHADELLRSDRMRRALDDLPDRTALHVITIDGPRTTDWDDALSVETLDDGTVELGVHVTHPPALIDPGSPIDRDARARGTTAYFPDQRVPMLPDPVEDALGLRAGTERPVLSLRVRVDPWGEIDTPRFERARIRIAENLTYDRADQLLAAGAAWEPTERTLLALRRTTDMLAWRRDRDGATELAVPEIEIHVVDGAPVIERREKGSSLSRALVGELMILFNSSIAELAWKHRVPIPYRGQERREDTDDTPAHPDPLFHALRLMRQMRPASSADRPVPHAALAVAGYAQATSPLRRYNDLLIHHQIGALLAGQPPPLNAEEVMRAAREADHAAGSLLRAVRDVQEYWKLRDLQRRTGQDVELLVLERPRGSLRANCVLVDSLLRTPIQLRRELPEGARFTGVIESVEPRRGLVTILPRT